LNINEVKKEINNAKVTLYQADWIIEDCIEIIVGRLKSATIFADYQHNYCKNLSKLKKELNSFNASTLRWKE
jgi:hypothetical protein